MGTLASELGPHVEEFSQRPRIYADANVPAGTIAYMRERLQWDVLAVVEQDELRRASDVEHYGTARRLRRTLISLDDDFLDERRFPPDESPGVIVLSAPDERGLTRLLRRIGRAFFFSRNGRPKRLLAPPLVGRKIQVHPDWSGPSETNDPSDPVSRRPRRKRQRTRQASP